MGTFLAGSGSAAGSGLMKKQPFYFQVKFYFIGFIFISVSDWIQLNPGPDPAKYLNPDPDPRVAIF